MKSNQGQAVYFVNKPCIIVNKICSQNKLNKVVIITIQICHFLWISTLYAVYYEHFLLLWTYLYYEHFLDIRLINKRSVIIYNTEVT